MLFSQPLSILQEVKKEMKKIAVSLISIVTLSMLLMSVAPVFAAKPAPSAYATWWGLNSPTFQFNVINDGGVAIVKVRLVVSDTTVTAWEPTSGWSTTGSANDVTFWAKGKSVIRLNQAGTFFMTVSPAMPFHVTWTAYDRKDNIVASGTELLVPPPL